MPLTTGLTSLTAAKGEGHIHSEKWHRCIQHVKAKGGGYDPYAVCTFSIGYNESINKEHQTPGPHSSRDTRRFKRRKERQEKDQKMESYAAVLKFDVHRVLKEHKCWGHACGGGKGKGSGDTPVDYSKRQHIKEGPGKQLGKLDEEFNQFPPDKRTSEQKEKDQQKIHDEYDRLNKAIRGNRKDPEPKALSRLAKLKKLMVG